MFNNTTIFPTNQQGSQVQITPQGQSIYVVQQPQAQSAFVQYQAVPQISIQQPYPSGPQMILVPVNGAQQQQVFQLHNNQHQMIQIITQEAQEQPMELSYIQSQESISFEKSPQIQEIVPKVEVLSKVATCFNLAKSQEDNKVLPKFQYIDQIMESVEVKQLQFFCLSNRRRGSVQRDPMFEFTRYQPLRKIVPLQIKHESKNLWKKQINQINKQKLDKKQSYESLDKIEIKKVDAKINGPFQIWRNQQNESQLPEELFSNRADVNLNGMNNLVFKASEDVLSAKFMKINKIKPGYQVSIIPGQDFNPRMFGFSDHIPSSDKYTFYYIKKDDNLKKQYRLFECNHCSNTGQRECFQIIQGMSKFFAHLRVHTKEKPYKCTYQNCGSAFCQMGNLHKHLEAHAGIKKYNCDHCERQFSKKFNLRMHLKSVQFKKNKKINLARGNIKQK